MENKILRRIQKGRKYIPITKRYQQETYKYKYIHVRDTKNFVDKDWLIGEMERLAADGIKCWIEEGVLWRVEPDYILNPDTDNKYYI